MIKDKDNGYRDLLGAYKGSGRISVGILEAKGAAPKEVREPSASADSLTLIQVAEWMEFGTRNIPARPFIRGFADNFEPEVRGWIGAALARVRKGGDMAMELEKVGLRLQAGVQEFIAFGDFAPLSPRTIARKGSSRPLIDTGQLRSAISYKVEITEVA